MRPPGQMSTMTSAPAPSAPCTCGASCRSVQAAMAAASLPAAASWASADSAAMLAPSSRPHSSIERSRRICVGGGRVQHARHETL